MPIDTSSYYPEVEGDEKDDGYSLNRKNRGLFGEKPSEPQPEEKVENNHVPEVESGQESAHRRRGDKDTPDEGATRAVDWISHILSWVLVPLLMPVYGMLMIFHLSILEIAPLGTRLAFTGVVLGIDVVLPMVTFWVLRKMGLVDDIGLNERKERLIPYIITLACLGGTAVFMSHKGAPMWVTMFFAGGAVGALINLLVNFRWKISAHAAGIAGIVALLVRILKDGYPETAVFTWLIIWICLTGLLGSARVWLGRHTVWQVVAGYAVGFCSVFFMTMIQ